MMVLSSILLAVVIFSAAAESPTYIIAMTGVALWFVLQHSPKKKYVVFLLVFAIILTSFSPSDIFPSYLREHFIRPYALKALPCVLIWFVLIYDMITRNFAKSGITTS